MTRLRIARQRRWALSYLLWIDSARINIIDVIKNESMKGEFLNCTIAGDRVLISGHDVQYLTGLITVEE